MRRLGFILITVIIVLSCQHDIPEMPEEQAGVSELEYSEDTLKVIERQTITSSMPSYESNVTSFSLVVSPENQAIAIDENGIIYVNESAFGIYNITVIASNEVGSTSFNDVLVVEVLEEEKTGIAELTYTEDTLSVSKGEAISSSIPTFENDPLVSFSLMVSPLNDQISINEEGVVTVDATSEAGRYTISVIATNEDGISNFSNVLVVEIEAPFVSFALDVFPITNTKCSPCHTTGSQSKFNNYDVASAKITSLLDRVQRDQDASGFMPRGGAPLSEEEINMIKTWQTDGFKE